MRSTLAAPALAFILLSPCVHAEEPAPPAVESVEAPAPRAVAILAENLNWTASEAGIQTAWMLGAENQVGPYVERVRLGGGGRIGAHTHPDDRIVSVLQGTLYVGFGTIFDETRVAAVPAGAICLIPADQPHYLWAQDGEVEFQESGFGPSASDFSPR